MNTVLDILKLNGIAIPDNNTPDSDAAVKIKQLFADLEGIDIAKIVNEASMVYDLGMDALDVVEFLMELEKAFDLVLPEEIDEAFWGEEIPYLAPGADKKEALKEKLKGIEEGIALLRKIWNEVKTEKDNPDNEYADWDKDAIEEIEEEVDNAEHELKNLNDEFDKLKEDAIEEFAKKVKDLEETVSILKGEELLKGDATVGEMIAVVEWLVKQQDKEKQ